MILHKVTWERYDSNSYVLAFNGVVIIIDSNCELLAYLKVNNIIPDYLFATHEHFDHIEGIGNIKNAYPNMKVYAAKSASEMFSDETCNMSFFFLKVKMFQSQRRI